MKVLVMLSDFEGLAQGVARTMTIEANAAGLDFKSETEEEFHTRAEGIYQTFDLFVNDCCDGVLVEFDTDTKTARIVPKSEMACDGIESTEEVPDSALN